MRIFKTLNFVMKKYNWRFLVGQNKNDVEKAVLPTILYINPNHEAFEEDRMPGFMIVLGWWDFSIKFGLIISA